MSLESIMQRHHQSRWSGTREQLLALLARHWGHTAFLPGQEPVLEAVCAGRDVLAVLPTGGGKSLCYQLPALIGRGLTVVVSPLLSLMTDQVAAMTKRGIAAARIDSSMHPTEADEVARRAHRGDLRLLYMSPERLAGPDGMALVNRCVVDRFVVDEAHCISTWGPDFRPAYSQLSLLTQLWPSAPILAVTATADEASRESIVDSLRLRDPFMYVGSFDRSNLRLHVAGRAVFQDDQVCEWIRIAGGADRGKAHRGGVIIYCPTRREVESLTERLNDRLGGGVARYHAGLSDEERQQTQERFASGELDVVVATVAFGMGIDRPDVRLVIHTMMPSSLEQYHQEIGRAGRDGAPAHAVMLASTSDIEFWETVLGLEDYDQLLSRGGADAIRRADPDGRLTARYEALWAAQQYAFACGAGYDTTCRHAHLAAHFGEDVAPCGDRCDACTGGRQLSAVGSQPDERSTSC